jgi:hypothetical protein
MEAVLNEFALIKSSITRLNVFTSVRDGIQGRARIRVAVFLVCIRWLYNGNNLRQETESELPRSYQRSCSTYLKSRNQKAALTKHS